MAKPNDSVSLNSAVTALTKGIIMSEQPISVMTTNKIVALNGKPTKKCFTGWHYTFRGNFDEQLPVDQSPSIPCISTLLSFTASWHFAKGARDILGISTRTDAKLLGTALIESGHTMTLTQVEELVAKTECHEKTGLFTGRSYFFIETKNQEDPVVVGSVARYGMHWYARIYSLDNGWDRNVFDYLLVRNLDTSKF